MGLHWSWMFCSPSFCLDLEAWGQDIAFTVLRQVKWTIFSGRVQTWLLEHGVLEVLNLVQSDEWRQQLDMWLIRRWGQRGLSIGLAWCPLSSLNVKVVDDSENEGVLYVYQMDSSICKWWCCRRNWTFANILYINRSWCGEKCNLLKDA